MRIKTHQTITGAVVIVMVAFLMMLIGVDLYPLLSGNDGYTIEQQAWLQVARDE